MGTTEVIQDTKTILPTISLLELRQTVEAIENNIEKLDIKNDLIITKELENIHAKLIAIEPSNRSKRGLFNIVGSAEK